MDTTQSPVAGGTTVANWIPDFKSQAKYVSKSEFEKHQKKHKTSVPILMYHRFYKSKTESKDANDFSVTLFEKQLKYFKDNNFYFPPWDELYCFIQKKCILPDKSVIITSDDFRKSFRKYIPALVDKYKIPVTSFDITGVEKPKWLSPYIIMRSHSDKMHAAGVGGKGRITSWAMKDIVEDLNTSIKKLRGVAQVFAYPFGHYNKHAITGLKKAGFQMAVTVEYGEVKPGANPYLLPRVRRNDGAFFK
jgi:peptidoglycan/xylan/chitin deacetylase (PgdA/CDA1 family)